MSFHAINVTTFNTHSPIQHPLPPSTFTFNTLFPILHPLPLPLSLSTPSSLFSIHFHFQHPLPYSASTFTSSTHSHSSIQ